MKIFQKIRTLTRIQIMINIAFTALFIIVCLIYYIQRKSSLLNSSQNRMERDLDELAQFVENNLKRDKDVLNLAVNIADYRINQYADIEQTDSDKSVIKAVDPYTNEPIETSIIKWKVDGLDIENNFQLVDELKILTKADVSIYQKCDRGYVNISTNMVNTADDRMTGDIILNSSPIAKSVESGNQYTGRFHGKSAWFVASYKPIHVDGKIQGIYYVGLRERMGAALKGIFEKRIYYSTGYPFLLSDNGNLIVHPFRQGEDLSTTKVFKEIIRLGKNKNTIDYAWPETGKSKTWRLHYKFHEQTKIYICITYPLEEIYESLNIFIIIAFAGYIFFMISLQFILYISFKSLKEKLRNLRKILNKLAKGEVVKNVSIQGEKEFIDISDKIGQISERYQVLSKFARGLANDNYSQTYPKSFINDEIGESLIKINDKLNEAMYNEHIRQKEEKLRTWESEGLSKFVNILQRNRDKLEDLCYELISNLVDYLNANLGALFFLNNDDPNDIHFMQMATYAYEKKRIINRKIYPEQGLIGRVFNEKQTIYLNELPEDYITITSGLGEGIPKNLLIVPLLINKEVYGAIEIASFSLLKGYQIEFIEKIGENIASTINNVLVNNKTRELLEQSRAQSELLSEQEEIMRKNLIELKNIQKETELGIYEMKDVFKLLEDFMLMAELNITGEICSVNNHVADFFAMEKSTLIGKHYSDYSHFIPVDEYKGLINAWDILMKGKRVQIDIKVKSGTGKMKSILLNMMPKLEKDKVERIILAGVEFKAKI